jgi:hypothetical protein
MGDLKSKLPDLKELGEMSNKLFKDIKASVCEIMTSYKQKHPAEKASKPAAKKAKTTAAPKKTKDEK